MNWALSPQNRGISPWPGKRFEAAAELYKQLNRPTDLLRTCINLISLAREEKNLELAWQYYEQGYALTDKTSGAF